MSQSITVRSFAELAELLDFEVTDSSTSPGDDEFLGTPGSETDGTCQNVVPDLSALLARLERATADLAAVASADRKARDLAQKDLERYDSLIQEAEEAERVGERAREARREAESLLSSAFSPEAREAAKGVADLASQVEAEAAEVVALRRKEAESLGERPEIKRLIADRKEREEAEKRRAAEIVRSRRLEGALASIREMVETGRLEEAQTLLGAVATEYPESAEVRSLAQIIAQRVLLVKVQAAERALWLARRDLRHDPAAALDILTALDVEGLPEPLSRQVFGEWARVCSRVCQERGTLEPLRYAPNPGRGAVIAKEQDGCWVVVSSLGLDGNWAPGHPVDERIAARSRPLR